jgi:hypothetical protein
MPQKATNTSPRGGQHVSRISASEGGDARAERRTGNRRAYTESRGEEGSGSGSEDARGRRAQRALAGSTDTSAVRGRRVSRCMRVRLIPMLSLDPISSRRSAIQNSLRNRHTGQ